VRNQARQRLIELWIKVYRTAPNQPARVRAKAELELLGVQL